MIARRASCQPQSFEVANAATQAFLEEYLQLGAARTSSATGRDRDAVGDQARDHVGQGHHRFPSGPAAATSSIVDYDPATDEPAPPSCFDETPVLYVNPKRVTG